MSRDFSVRQGRGREGVAELRQAASDAAWRKKIRHGLKGLVQRFLSLVTEVEKQRRAVMIVNSNRPYIPYRRDMH